ncbi:MAG: hypothetical protein Q3972_08910 [Corynebacterium sp.]|nr:hypothetical protein [Corynebacterium sp.]
MQKRKMPPRVHEWCTSLGGAAIRDIFYSIAGRKGIVVPLPVADDAMDSLATALTQGALLPYPQAAEQVWHAMNRRRRCHFPEAFVAYGVVERKLGKRIILTPIFLQPLLPGPFDSESAFMGNGALHLNPVLELALSHASLSPEALDPQTSTQTTPSNPRDLIRALRAELLQANFATEVSTHVHLIVPSSCSPASAQHLARNWHNFRTRQPFNYLASGSPLPLAEQQAADPHPTEQLPPEGTAPAVTEALLRLRRNQSFGLCAKAEPHLLTPALTHLLQDLTSQGRSCLVVSRNTQLLTDLRAQLHCAGGEPFTVSAFGAYGQHVGSSIIQAWEQVATLTRAQEPPFKLRTDTFDLFDESACQQAKNFTLTACAGLSPELFSAYTLYQQTADSSTSFEVFFEALIVALRLLAEHLTNYRSNNIPLEECRQLIFPTFATIHAQKHPEDSVVGDFVRDYEYLCTAYPKVADIFPTVVLSLLNISFLIDPYRINAIADDIENAVGAVDGDPFTYVQFEGLPPDLSVHTIRRHWNAALTYARLAKVGQFLNLSPEQAREDLKRRLSTMRTALRRCHSSYELFQQYPVALRRSSPIILADPTAIALFLACRGAYDYVFIDAASISHPAEAALALGHANAVVLFSQDGMTKAPFMMKRTVHIPSPHLQGLPHIIIPEPREP